MIGQGVEVLIRSWGRVGCGLDHGTGCGGPD